LPYLLEERDAIGLLVNVPVFMQVPVTHRFDGLGSVGCHRWISLRVPGDAISCNELKDQAAF